MANSDVRIPDDIIAILEDSDKELWNSRYERALKVALEQKLAAETIREIVLYFKTASFDLADKFAWIGVLEKAGYDRETLCELLLDRFEVSDYNCDLPTIRRGEFLRHPPAWRLVEPGQLIVFIEKRMVEISGAEDVLGLNVELAVKIGQKEADRLAGLACRHVRRLTANAIKTLQHLSPRCRLEVATGMANSIFQNPAFLRGVDELGFFVRAVVEFDTKDILLSALSYSVRNPWKHGESKERNSEPERPIVAYRWILKTLRDPQLPHEAWMDSCGTTPEKVAQLRVEKIDKVLRKVLEEVGFCFTRVHDVLQEGVTQFEAVVVDGPWKTVFIEKNDSKPRYDIIRNETEVIVPRCPTGKVLFERDRVRWYLCNMHSAESPTPEMEALVRQNHNCF